MSRHHRKNHEEIDRRRVLNASIRRAVLVLLVFAAFLFWLWTRPASITFAPPAAAITNAAPTPPQPRQPTPQEITNAVNALMAPSPQFSAIADQGPVPQKSSTPGVAPAGGGMAPNYDDKLDTTWTTFEPQAPGIIYIYRVTPVAKPNPWEAWQSDSPRIPKGRHD